MIEKSWSVFLGVKEFGGGFEISKMLINDKKSE